MEFHDIVIQQKSYFDSNSTKKYSLSQDYVEKIDGCP